MLARTCNCVNSKGVKCESKFFKDGECGYHGRDCKQEYPLRCHCLKKKDNTRCTMHAQSNGMCGIHKDCSEDRVVPEPLRWVGKKYRNSVNPTDISQEQKQQDAFVLNQFRNNRDNPHVPRNWNTNVVNDFQNLRFNDQQEDNTSRNRSRSSSPSPPSLSRQRTVDTSLSSMSQKSKSPSTLLRRASDESTPDKHLLKHILHIFERLEKSDKKYGDKPVFLYNDIAVIPNMTKDVSAQKFEPKYRPSVVVTIANDNKTATLYRKNNRSKRYMSIASI